MALITLVSSAMLTPGLKFTEVRPVLEGDLPTSDRLVRDTTRFADRYPDRNYYVIGIEAPENADLWNTGSLAKVAKLSSEAATLPGALPNVQSLATWDHIVATDDLVEVRPLMAEAPTEPAGVAELKAIVTRDPLLGGRLVSPDGRMALIRVAFRGDAVEAEVHDGLETLRERFSGPESISVFGEHHINREIDIAMEEHLRILLPVASFLLLACIYLAFGQWRAVWVGASLIVLTVVDFAGLMGTLEIPRSILSSVIPILLVVVLGSYLIHLLQRVDEESSHLPWPEAVRIGLTRTLSPILWAAFTSGMGFATLVVFRIHSVREFGLLAATGVAIGAVLAVTWVPAILVLAGPGRAHRRVEGRSVFDPAVDLLVKLGAAACGDKRGLVLGLSAATLCVSATATAWLQVGSNPPEFFHAGHPVHSDFTSLHQHFGGNGYLFAEFEAPIGSDIYDPSFLERVVGFQRDAALQDLVGFTSSAADTVVMRMHRRMHGDDPTMERLPDNRHLAAQYLELYRWDAPQTLAEMVEDIDAPRRMIVDLFVNINDSARIAQLIEALDASIDRWLPSEKEGTAIFGGDFVAWSAQIRYIVEGKLLSIVAAVAMVALICTVAFRRARLGLMATLPAACVTVVVLGLMGATGLRLDLASCVITSVIVGVGADFPIHFLTRRKELLAGRDESAGTTAVVEDTVRVATRPILLDAITNVVAFGVFVFSPFSPVRALGLLICVSMAACTLATVTLLPALLVSSRS